MNVILIELSSVGPLPPSWEELGRMDEIKQIRCMLSKMLRQDMSGSVTRRPYTTRFLLVTRLV